MSDRIRIAVLVPVTLEGIGDQAMYDLLQVYERYKEPGTELRAYKIRRGSSTVETHYDEQLSGAFCLPEVERAEREGAQAVVNSCFGDPALAASREAVGIPVVGTGQTSMFVAAMLGRKFSILATDESAVGVMYDLARAYGLHDRLASIRCIGSGVGEVLSREDGRSPLERLKQAVREAARQAVEEDGADVLLLGCGGLSMDGLVEWLQAEMGVPVVDSNAVTLKMAELLVKCRLSQSKKAFPFPKQKPRSW